MRSETVLTVKKSVGIFIRVSTDDQAQGDSPKHHELRARDYAKLRGWSVSEVYDLAGVSGKSVMEHPETKRMLADVARGHIQGLIFSKLARLARNTRELLEFADYFQKHNSDLISLGETIDTSTPAGRLFFTVIAAMATWEREEIAERVKASVKVRAKLGKPLAGRVAYGYHYKEGKIQPHPSEAPVRKLIYELFAKHKRKKAVARLLNEKGLRTRGQSLFSDTTIDYLIRDTTAKGEYRANYTRNNGVGKPWALKPEHEWIVSKVEAIIPENLWDECNHILEARKVKGAKVGRSAVHTFTGFVFCECGKKMYVPSSTPKYVCYTCHTKIAETDLDATFHDELKNFLTSPEKVADYLGRATTTLADKERLLESMKKEGQRLKGDIEKLYELYSAGALSTEQFKTRFQPLEGRRVQLDGETPHIEAEIAALKIDGLSQEQILSEGQSFHSRWPKMSVEEKREIVEIMVEKIVIGEKEIDIRYCYVPSSEEVPERQRALRDSSRRPA